MVNGHSSAADWADSMVAGIVGHIESLMVAGCDFATARAQAVAQSVAGPMTLRRVDQHFVAVV